MGEQLTFDFPLVNVEEGDVLLFCVEPNGFSFINEFGFKTKPLPEFAYIKVSDRPIGVCLAACGVEGLLRYIDTKPCVYSKDCFGKIILSPFNLHKLWDNDIVTVKHLHIVITASFELTKGRL